MSLSSVFMHRQQETVSGCYVDVCARVWVWVDVGVGGSGLMGVGFVCSVFYLEDGKPETYMDRTA